MTEKNIINEAVESSSNRRGLLKKLGLASAAVAAGATIGSKRLSAAAAPSAVDVVQFALNLEYLEGEFYSVATTGKTLEERGYDVSGIGTPGPTTTTYGQVNFANNFVLTRPVAMDIAADEIAHVQVLRRALLSTGYTPIAKPAIDLDVLAAKGASLANEQAFLTLSRMFEDIGVSAYAGGADFLSGSPYLQTAARILSVEGEHVANVRLQIARLGIATMKLDGADILPPISGSNFFSTNIANGLTAVRTPGEVLYLAYGNVAGATKGGFFPKGVNGVLNTSSAAATASNLNT